MEEFNLGYSTKNIPIPEHKEYLKSLIQKTESLLRRMRWKAFFFLNPDAKRRQKETFGFNSTKTPMPVRELHEFENIMLKLIQDVKFKSTPSCSSNFQRELSKNAKEIRNDDNLLVAADKTTNFYRVAPVPYNKLLKSNITKTYKKAPSDTASQIEAEEKKIATNLDLDDRINITPKANAFVTLKDHKPNFKNKPTCRLINPSKSEIGKISKQILERINRKVVAATKINQWKNTSAVIDWYKNIPIKDKHSFICFDVVEFYPSITEDLLIKALQFASHYDKITDEEKHIIMQAKNSLLFHDDTAWRKKDATSLFDVTMGSFDGAETCELVGSYLLHQLPAKYRNQIGLYRDDGLAAFNTTPRRVELIKKDICKLFSDHNLRITIEANKKTVNFLDVTLDLCTGTFSPYMKPNSKPLYVHKDSNHPPSILRNIPIGINRRLSSISSDKTSFDKATKPYQDALQESGYDHKLEFNPVTNPATKKRTRHRNIIWFNPPYSANVDTNIGRKFLQIVDQCFPKAHVLHQIFNRNTLKLSYSCMPNMKAAISSHNKSVLKKEETNHNQVVTKKCNCIHKDECPLDQNCQTMGVVYQATVTRSDINKKETYIGLTNTTFKTRYNNHTSSFDTKKRDKGGTALAKYIWKLMDLKVTYSIKWNIIKKCQGYSNITKRCNLCLYEKYMIICHPEMCTLNKRNELVSTCRHRKSFLLCKSKAGTTVK